jgi:hypothetical protein
MPQPSSYDRIRWASALGSLLASTSAFASGGGFDLGPENIAIAASAGALVAVMGVAFNIKAARLLFSSLLCCGSSTGPLPCALVWHLRAAPRRNSGCTVRGRPRVCLWVPSPGPPSVLKRSTMKFVVLTQRPNHSVKGTCLRQAPYVER